MSPLATAAAALCAATGLALSFDRRRHAAAALVVLVASAAVASVTPLPWAAGSVRLGAWIAAAATAVTVHLPRRRFALALLLGADAGLWTGAAASIDGAFPLLPEAAPWALLCLPGGWLAARRWGVAVKVAASWLLAVAVLAAALPLAPRPSPTADHLD